jgi:hypothetical protein
MIRPLPVVTVLFTSLASLGLQGGSQKGAIILVEAICLLNGVILNQAARSSRPEGSRSSPPLCPTHKIRNHEVTNSR